MANVKRTLFRSITKTILLAGFIAGTLDILFAIIFLASGNAEAVFRYIARGALGEAAYQGGFEMILLGLVFHYIIAYCFTIGYFLVSPLFPFLHKQKIAVGLLYGVFVWAFMHFIVLPFTHNPPGPVTLKGAWKNIVILMFAVGLPVVIMAGKYYDEKNAAR